MALAAPLIAPPRIAPGETLAAFRALDGHALAHRQDAQWVDEQLQPLPASWFRRLFERWRRSWRDEGRFEANAALLQRVRSIRRAECAGVQLDASDSELCTAADLCARDMARRLDLRDMITANKLRPAVSSWSVDWTSRAALLARFDEAMHWLRLKGLQLDVRGPIEPFLRRVVCARWWRRILRTVHAKAVEGTARAIGLVHKRAGCYVSDDGMRQRIGQRARNQRALESVHAVNEHGQDATLAELAAKGPANREIRRHELMTRIAGFELIARQCGHEALFVTVTCPSRMHAYRTAGAGVERNPKHDGTTPDEAQRYLSRQWAAFRSACQRWGVELYGFRIAEPNHDGTPHWHALLFLPRTVARGTVAANPRAGRPVADRVALRLLRRYFLRDAGTLADRVEKGARAHRVKVERIDWSRGSAAGYVAKYVAKNIDGYRVEKDLYGNDALTSSQRVDAWAARWRVRQFQQIGGAPVGVWRELRRLHPEQADAAPAVAMMLDAVNVSADADKLAPFDGNEGKPTAAHGWASYVELQGGPRVPRRELRMRLLREQVGELGRYGELMPPRTVGVECTHVERVDLGIVRGLLRTRVVGVESERAQWIIGTRAAVAALASPGGGPMGVGEPAAAGPLGGLPCGEAARPWSPVNNCTRPVANDHHPAALFGPLRVRKRGRWMNWSRGRASATEKPPCEPPPPSPRLPAITSTRPTRHSSPSTS